MRSITLLLTAGLVLLPLGAEDPHKPAKAAKTGIVVPPPETDKGHAETAKDKQAKEVKPGTKAKEEAKEETHEAKAPDPAPRPVVRRKPPAPRPAENPRISEAEVRAARLLEENARLQQEIAKRQGYSPLPVGTPDQAKAELLAGNDRFVAGKRVRTLLSSQDLELRDTLSRGQSPFAVIVTCSDSRLADNVLFDQELGRLFTIREAGNSPDIQGLASIEYAVEHLGSKLVVVMGHTACGAIKAVKESKGKPMPGNLWVIQASMAGLLEVCHEDPNEHPSAHITRLAEVNAQRQVQGILDRSEIVRHLVGTGKVQVVPALYDLASGRVKFLTLPKAGGAPAAHH